MNNTANSHAELARHLMVSIQAMVDQYLERAREKYRPEFSMVVQIQCQALSEEGQLVRLSTSVLKASRPPVLFAEPEDLSFSSEEDKEHGSDGRVFDRVYSLPLLSCSGEEHVGDVQGEGSDAAR
jgi:hypothetical protein